MRKILGPALRAGRQTATFPDQELPQMRLALQAVLAGGMLLALSYQAQAQQAYGNIIVTAEAGDAVLIYSPDVGVKKERKFEEAGKSQFRRLPVGYYEVTITKASGEVVETVITLRAGETGRAP